MSANSIWEMSQPTIASAGIMSNFNKGRQDQNLLMQQALQNQQIQQQMAQDSLMNPMRLAQAGQVISGEGQRQQLLGSEAEQIEKSRITSSLYKGVQALKPFLAKGDLMGAKKAAALFTEYGLPPEVESEALQMLESGDIDGINQHIQAIDALGKDDKQQATYDIGATQELIDENGNLFTGLTVTDRKTGQPRAEVVPMVPGTYPVGQLRQRTSYGVSFEDQLSKKTAADIATKAGTTAIEAETAPVIAGNVTAAQEQSKDVAAWQQKQEDGWFAAQSALTGINKMIDILPSIGTGKPEAFLQAGLSLFGAQNVDAERFSALARKQVLSDIKALGANPTEGERAFIMTLQASLENGEEVNTEMLQDLKRVNERMIDRGRWVAENPGKGAKDYIREFGDMNQLWSSELNESVTMAELEQEAKDSGISVAKLKAQLGIR